MSWNRPPQTLNVALDGDTYTPSTGNNPCHRRDSGTVSATMKGISSYRSQPSRFSTGALNNSEK